jgi:hypothetical protein
MSLTEVPRAAWTAALNDFSSAHEGWLVKLDVWTPEIGSLPELDDLPLIGVSADRSVDGAITVSAAAQGGLASHTIHHASSVTLERDRHGVVSAMHIESAGGVKTTLRFRMPPDGA